MIGGMFILFLVLLLLNVPIAFSLGASSLFYLLTSNMNAAVLAQKFYAGIDSFTLLCIPGFMLAGALMNGGGITRRILNFCNAFLGHFTGSLALVNIVASMVFAGISGTAIADVCSLGGMLIPAMVEDGYDDDFSVAVTAASSVVGPIIPPSTNFILLGATISGLSITKLFMIGLFPGIFIGLALMVVWFFIVRIDGYNETITFTREEKWKIIRDATPAFMMPVLLLGGIRFGVFTPTEGGAFAAVYAILVCLLWYREIGLKDLLKVSASSARTTAAVMMIVATATAIGYFITLADIPQQIISLFAPFKDSPIILLLLINVFLFLIGMVMDLTPNVLIFAPVFYPLILDAGIDPYHFGLIFILNLGIGVITPPVGTVLYVVCGIGNLKLPDLVKNLLPFLFVEVVMLLLLTVFPKLSLIPMGWLI